MARKIIDSVRLDWTDDGAPMSEEFTTARAASDRALELGLAGIVPSIVIDGAPAGNDDLMRVAALEQEA